MRERTDEGAEVKMLGTLVWIIWALWDAAFINVDRRIRVARVAAAGGVDFTEGRALWYLILSFIASWLVLPVYFYATRKRPSAILLGILATLATASATVVTLVVISLALT